MPPSPEEALEAIAIMDQYSIFTRRTPEGWEAYNSKQHLIKSAGVHPESYLALLAAKAVILARDSSERSDRALVALNACQSSSYRPRQRDIPDPSPEAPAGATVRVWDIVRAGGGVTTVTGRLSLLKALEDAAIAEMAGTL